MAFFAAACGPTAGTLTGSAGTSGTAGTTGNNCTGTKTACGTECIDTTADPMNCGGCGIPCSTGQICQNSVCQCQAGLLDCNGSCVQSDASHCGSCTTVCLATQVCSNGACGGDCNTGQTMCGTACPDLSTSNLHCGSCGHACGSNQRCENFSCVDISTTGTGGTTGSAGTSGSAGSSGTGGAAGSGPGTGGSTAGRGGTTGAAGRGGTTGSAGSTAGTTGSAGTTGTGGTGGSAPVMTLVTSGPSGGYWTTTGTLTTSTGTAEVTVNDATTMQTWEGFGGSFNEKGWQYLSSLSEADRNKALQLLFGADGAKFAFGRIPIGSSDYAMNRYTLDEVASGQTDPNLASFSITRDTNQLIPYIKAAQAVKGNIRFWASPWTPPTWMKSSPYQSGNMVSPFDGGTMKSDAATLTAYAQYLIRWVQAYKDMGINVEAVAPQNEPNFGQNYPSALWATSTYVTFVGRYLGPAIAASTNPGLKVMLGTMSNGDSGKDPAILTGVMNDATAKPFVKVIGMQWGMLNSLSTARSYNLPLWQTEHKCGNYPWEGGYVSSAAPNNQAYGVETWNLIRDWIKGGVTSYQAWNMVLDTVGKGIDTTRDWAQNALLTVNTGSRTLNITPAYHVFRHFSQFVDPGAKVVATTGGDALAFKNPSGTIVTVMYNSGGAKTSIVQAAGKKVSFSMPATGWATVVLSP